MAGDVRCTTLPNGSLRHLRCCSSGFQQLGSPILCHRPDPSEQQSGSTPRHDFQKNHSAIGEPRVTCWRQCGGRCPGARECNAGVWPLSPVHQRDLGMLPAPNRGSSPLGSAWSASARAGTSRLSACGCRRCESCSQHQRQYTNIQGFKFLTTYPLVAAVSGVGLKSGGTDWPADTRP